MVVAQVSRINNKVNEMELPISVEQYEAWQGGALIQNVMPHLTPARREFLISGSTPEEWE